MKFFDINEELKERMVMDCGAEYAKTVFHENGLQLIPEPFYETVVFWRGLPNKQLVNRIIDVLMPYYEEINKDSEMTEALFEMVNGGFVITWSTFKDKEPPDGLYE